MHQDKGSQSNALATCCFTWEQISLARTSLSRSLRSDVAISEFCKDKPRDHCHRLPRWPTTRRPTSYPQAICDTNMARWSPPSGCAGLLVSPQQSRKSTQDDAIQQRGDRSRGRGGRHDLPAMYAAPVSLCVDTGLGNRRFIDGRGLNVRHTCDQTPSNAPMMLATSSDFLALHDNLLRRAPTSAQLSARAARTLWQGAGSNCASPTVVLALSVDGCVCLCAL